MTNASTALSPRWSARQGWIVFGFSLGLLLFELCLTRVLSVFFYYHTAFLAVSFAMLGVGVGGVWVYLFPRTLRRGPQLWMLAAGAGMAALPVLLGLLRFDHSYLKALWSGPFLGIFAIVSLVCLLPFLAGGVVLAWWFRAYNRHAAALYAWDLVGAAAGALLLVPLMETLGGPSALFACSVWLLLCTAADAFRAQRRRLGLVTLVVGAAALALLVIHQRTDRFAIQVDLDHTKSAQPKVLYKKWNAFSRVVLVKNQQWFRGLSGPRLVHWRSKLPAHRYALLDINAFAPFVRFDGDRKKVAFLKELSSNLAYHLLPVGQKVLVIGPGGGKDILGALLFRPHHITGIEINPILVRDLARQRLRSFVGDLYRHPKVTIHVGDGRSVLQQLPSKKRFDVIVANSVATWAAHSSGAMNLAEHSLYTVEACGLYLDRLTDRGILSVSLWDINQHAIPLRWIRTCEKAAQARGIPSLRHHVAVIANLWDAQTQFVTVLISRRPFTPTQRNTLATLAHQWSYAVYYLPQTPGNKEVFNMYFGKPDKMVQSFPQDISAATDDRPFFLYTVRWKDALQFWKRKLWEEDAALVNLLLSLFVVTALLLVLIGGPLLWQRFVRPSQQRLAWRDILYFLAIGWGFMLVEIPLIQRLTLWLGHPTYALTVVLAGLLFFSGLGSAWAERWTQTSQPRRHTLRLFAALLATLLLLVVGLPVLLQHTLTLSLPWRILLALVVLAPLGVCMGMPLPLGMQHLSRHNPDGIPWAWGINGASSVVASVAAIGLAASVGFFAVLLAASGCYLLALLAALSRPASSGSPS